MPTDRFDDLAAFRAFLDAKLADPGNDLSLAEVLALWEADNQTDDERAEHLHAIGDGLAKAAAGRVQDDGDGRS